jgi:hypothetical protein
MQPHNTRNYLQFLVRTSEGGQVSTIKNFLRIQSLNNALSGTYTAVLTLYNNIRCNAYSNSQTIKVTVSPVIANNTVSSTPTVCRFYSAFSFLTGTTPTGVEVLCLFGKQHYKCNLGFGTALDS